MVNQDVLYDAKLHGLAHKIAGVIFEYATTDKSDKTRPCLEDCRMTKTPVSRRHSNGFILDFYCGVPHSLFTPWGLWYCFGIKTREDDGTWAKLLPVLRKRLYAADAGSDMGHEYFYLYKVDDERLPDPDDLGSDNFDDKVARVAWEHLQAEYAK